MRWFSRVAGTFPLTAITFALIVSPTGQAGELAPPRILDQYLAGRQNDQLACSNTVYAVQIDASMPALKKHGTLTGFKRIVRPGEIVYRGLRFTGDNLVKTQVIARFLARDTTPPRNGQDISVSRRNYIFTFERESDYNGLTAYVFLLKPRRKRAGLFRGELWLDAQTASPLRLWGDLVKSPSIFIRSFRFVQDYRAVDACAEPLRTLLTARTRIAGSVEIIVWMHPASESEATGAENAIPNSTSGFRGH